MKITIFFATSSIANIESLNRTTILEKINVFDYKYPFDYQQKKELKINFCDNLHFKKIIVLLHSLYWEWNV